MEQVVILIIAHKEIISEDEKASLKQCYKILGNYPIKLICPLGLNVSEYKKINANAEIDFIDPKWQATYEMFNRLKIEPFLYKRYSNYKFILFYELDAWVFKDELKKWCNAGYDYLGAPWIQEIKNGQPLFYPFGGNGGFSLRNVKAHLKVLSTWKIMKSPTEILDYHKKFHNKINLILRLPIIILRMLGYQNNSFLEMKKFAWNEDEFWSKIAPKILPKFKVAPSKISFKFAFEKEPSLLYKLNENNLPFGCHAWHKYETDFWKLYINN